MIPVKTGIAGFDEFLLGGLPPKIILLSGAPGSGNEVFARQVLFYRVKTCPVTYFTVNATAESVREDMAAYGWNLTPTEESGAWRFESLKDTKTSDLSEAILTEMRQSRAVAIDSVSELLLSHNIQDIVNLLTSMTHQNRKSQTFQLLLLTEGMQTPQEETTINHFAEGAINFALNWNSDSTSRQLIIRKMAGTIIPTRRLTYTLGRRGFIIETATRIS
ncbi:MAG: RAD55 family ATPase [Candidatus Bathyarchaeota archaeon]|nr:RAD55 family ATPase [Candidatus Bathyarchaeota archaeon]